MKRLLSFLLILIAAHSYGQQYMRPDAGPGTSSFGTTCVPSCGTGAYTLVNETTADDATTYFQNNAIPSNGGIGVGSEYKLSLSNISSPSSGTVTIRFRAQGAGGASGESVTYGLVSSTYLNTFGGSTIVTNGAAQSITRGSWVTYSFTTTVAAIEGSSYFTGWDNLVFYVVFNGGYTQSGDKLSITWVEVETPSAVGPANPPTSPVVDDATNTFDWTYGATTSVLSNHEFTIDGGTNWYTCTEKPLTVGNRAYSIGNVQVRVKAGTGYTASSSVSNATAYTVATYNDAIQSENLFDVSEDFTAGAAYWSNINVTITGDATLAPDGNTTADLITETAASGQHMVYRGSIDMSSYYFQQMTFSWYFKPNTTTNWIVFFSYSGQQAFVQFSSAGVSNTGYQFGSAPFYANKYFTVTSSSVAAAANGFYRVQIILVAENIPSGGTVSFNVLNEVGGNNNYTGSTSNNYSIWGAQLNRGNGAATYIKTPTSKPRRVSYLLE